MTCECCCMEPASVKVPSGIFGHHYYCGQCWQFSIHGPGDGDLRPEDSHPFEQPAMAWARAEEVDPREDERLREAPPWMEDR